MTSSAHWRSIGRREGHQLRPELLWGRRTAQTTLRRRSSFANQPLGGVVVPPPRRQLAQINGRVVVHFRIFFSRGLRKKRIYANLMMTSLHPSPCHLKAAKYTNELGWYANERRGVALFPAFVCLKHWNMQMSWSTEKKHFRWCSACKWVMQMSTYFYRIITANRRMQMSSPLPSLTPITKKICKWAALSIISDSDKLVNYANELKKATKKWNL